MSDRSIRVSTRSNTKPVFMSSRRPTSHVVERTRPNEARGWDVARRATRTHPIHAWAWELPLRTTRIDAKITTPNGRLRLQTTSGTIDVDPAPWDLHETRTLGPALVQRTSQNSSVFAHALFLYEGELVYAKDIQEDELELVSQQWTYKNTTNVSPFYGLSPDTSRKEKKLNVMSFYKHLPNELMPKLEMDANDQRQAVMQEMCEMVRGVCTGETALLLDANTTRDAFETEVFAPYDTTTVFALVRVSVRTDPRTRKRSASVTFCTESANEAFALLENRSRNDYPYNYWMYYWIVPSPHSWMTKVGQLDGEDINSLVRPLEQATHAQLQRAIASRWNSDASTPADEVLNNLDLMKLINNPSAQTLQTARRAQPLIPALPPPPAQLPDLRDVPAGNAVTTRRKYR